MSSSAIAEPVSFIKKETNKTHTLSLCQKNIYLSFLGFETLTQHATNPIYVSSSPSTCPSDSKSENRDPCWQQAEEYFSWHAVVTFPKTNVTVDSTGTIQPDVRHGWSFSISVSEAKLAHRSHFNLTNQSWASATMPVFIWTTTCWKERKRSFWGWNAVFCLDYFLFFLCCAGSCANAEERL